MRNGVFIGAHILGPHFTSVAGSSSMMRKQPRKEVFPIFPSTLDLLRFENSNELIIMFFIIFTFSKASPQAPKP